MEYVNPIRDKEVLEEMKEYLKSKSERDYVMFMVGINAGLRISDILSLRVKDVKGEFIHLKEIKTGKRRRIPINVSLREALSSYIINQEDHELLFKSRQKSRKGKVKAIDRTTAYRILKEAADFVGYKESIGTHTLRKTFGYMHYQKHKNVAVLQKIFNHDKEAYTMLYIGLEEEYLWDTIRNNNL